jgi:hypothetical protein
MRSYTAIFYPKLGMCIPLSVTERMSQVQRIIYYSGLVRRLFGCVRELVQVSNTSYKTMFVSQITLQLPNITNITYVFF